MSDQTYCRLWAATVPVPANKAMKHANNVAIRTTIPKYESPDREPLAGYADASLSRRVSGDTKPGGASMVAPYRSL